MSSGAARLPASPARRLACCCRACAVSDCSSLHLDSHAPTGAPPAQPAPCWPGGEGGAGCRRGKGAAWRRARSAGLLAIQAPRIRGLATSPVSKLHPMHSTLGAWRGVVWHTNFIICAVRGHYHACGPAAPSGLLTCSFGPVLACVPARSGLRSCLHPPPKYKPCAGQRPAGGPLFWPAA